MEHEAQVLLEFYDAWLCSLSFSRGRSLCQKPWKEAESRGWVVRW